MENQNLNLLCEGERGNAEPSKSRIRAMLEEVVFYAIILVGTLLLFLVLKPYYYVNSAVSDGVVAHGCMTVLIVALVIYGVYLALSGKLDRKTAIMLLFFVGIVLRIFYMLCTPITVRQHDTFNKSNTGHEAYAWTIFSTGKLPQRNDYQFYHPPLNALIQSAFMKAMEWFSGALTDIFGLEGYFPDRFLQNYSSARLPEGSEQRFFLFSTCQVLAVTYSVITCVYMLKLVNLFDFKGKTAVIVSAFVILFPRNIQFAGMVNNDALSFMFSVLALYCALKWQREGKKLPYVLLCALFCGLGMMTKLATATICLPIAGIFIYEFVLKLIALIKAYKQGKKGELKSFIAFCMQFVCFVVICAPIALWFQVYVKIKFDQGFGFVFDNLNHRLGTDHHSLFERLFVAFDLEEYFGSVFCIPFYKEGSVGNITQFNHYNLFNYSLRSALFGEFTLKGGEGFAVVSIVLAYAFSLLLMIGIIKSLVTYWGYCRCKNVVFSKVKIEFKDFLTLFLLVQSQVIPEIMFYIKMPYACTMDFRYIMPMIFAMAIMLGLVNKILVAEGSKFSLKLNTATNITAVSLLVCTTVLYMVCI